MSNVLYDQVSGVHIAVYNLVERAGPDLCVRGQLECAVPNDEVQRLEVIVLRIADAEESSAIVEYRASSIDVFLICI